MVAADVSLAERNKDIVRRLTDSFNVQDMSVIDELVAKDYVDNGPFHGQQPGREGMKQAHRTFYTGFPDIYETIDDIFAEDNRVVVRWTCRGTHKGNFAGIPATGKKVKVTGIDIYRLVDGRVVENWHNTDGLGLLDQLGMLPPLSVTVAFSWVKKRFGRVDNNTKKTA